MAFIGTFSPDVPLSNRNIIINGAMQVAQRGTSVTGITTNGYYTADRWSIGLSSAGTWTMNVESSAPTGTEFRKSANVICTTADSSLDPSNFITFLQKIEGQNCQGIKKGTANAESLTVAFWVKSSNTGTYICEFRDLDSNRQISKSYTIDAANTWEKKTITIPPDTTGQLDNDNESSFQLSFWLAAGSAYSSGTLNDTAWETTTGSNRAVGQLNLANLAGNYWAVTGVQLEIGETATNYEMWSYGQELALCQRYYCKTFSTETAPAQNTGYVGALGAISINAGAATALWVHFQFPSEMRAVPTITTFSPSAANANWYSPAGPSSTTTPGAFGNSTRFANIYNVSAPAGGADIVYYIQATASSEL